MYEKPPVTMNSPKMRENLQARGYSKRTAAVIAVLIFVFLVVNVVQFAVRFGGSVLEQLDAPTEDNIALPYYELTADEQAGEMVSRLVHSIEDVELSGGAATVAVRVWAPQADEIISSATKSMSTYFYNRDVRDGEPLPEDLQEDVLRTFETATEAASVEERTLDVGLTRSKDGFAVDERALEKDLLNAFDAVV